MERKPISNQIRFALSKRFPIATRYIELNRYRLETLPTAYGENQEVILTFEEEDEQGHSNPEHEGEIMLSVLSLLFECSVKKKGYRIDDLDISRGELGQSMLNRFVEGEITNADYAKSVSDLFTLGPQLVKQYVRSSNAYSLAITASELDRTLSFLLLVTALECISSQEEFCSNKELNKSEKSVERYTRLILEYCKNKEELFPQDGEDGFIRNLKTCYYSHRSGFVHGGKEVSMASRLADRINQPGVSHFVDGEEVVTPGLDWFFQVTRRTLLGFLSNFPRVDENLDSETLANLARERAVLMMKVASSDTE